MFTGIKKVNINFLGMLSRLHETISAMNLVGINCLVIVINCVFIEH